MTNGYLEIRGFGFDADACERIARKYRGAVAVSRYGASGELADYTAWIPCERADQHATFADVRADYPRAVIGRYCPDGLPYGTRSVWNTADHAEPNYR